MLRFALTMAVLLVVRSAPADDDSARLLDSIQGKWQRTVDRDGTVIRIVKAIEKEQETYSYFIGEEVVYAHRIDIKVTATAGGNVFSYENKKTIAGPDKGKQSDGKGWYIFKVDKDKWYEVHRMVPGETGEPWITTYDRVKK